MAKHTEKEILDHFKRESGNTHDGAVVAAYNLGYGQGEADVKEKAVHKDPDLAKEILTRRDEEAAAGDPEAEHERLEGLKRDAADKDDEAETGDASTRRGKKAPAGAEKTA